MKLHLPELTWLTGTMLLAMATVARPAMAEPPNITAQQKSSAEHLADERANRQRVAVAVENWAAGGTGFFDEILAEDVVWTIKGSSPSSGVYRGRRDFLERAVMPFAIRLSQPVRPVNWRLWVDGDHVILNWYGEGVARDGQRYRNDYAWILLMKEGQAREVTAFLDLAPYDDVLRRVPTPELAGE